MNIDVLSDSFYIQNVQINGRVLLAPMDGYTDSPFRLLCRNFGSSISTSEFLNGIDVTQGHPHLKFKTLFLEQERPFVYQIFDNDPKRLLQSALFLETLHPDMIDINMGCSARNVSNRGAGAGLLRDPFKIERIMALLTSNIKIPITAKIRLGWDETSKNYVEISRILEDCGASAVSVHARTRRQEYSGVADWDAIADIKSRLSIPVIGNGDVVSLDKARHMIKMTGCDAVMIGRAAIGNPWVFCGRAKDNVDRAELVNIIQEHISGMEDLYGPKIGVTLFRKHLSKYLSLSRLPAEQKKQLFSSTDQMELMNIIRQLLSSINEVSGENNVHLE